MYVYIYTRVYLCMYVCVHTHTYMYILRFITRNRPMGYGDCTSKICGAGQQAGDPGKLETLLQSEGLQPGVQRAGVPVLIQSPEPAAGPGGSRVPPHDV